MKLEIQAISVDIQKDAILRSVSLGVREGEFLSLLGPSGCGKSTLLKTIAGLLPIKMGKILISGQDVSSLPIHQRGTVVVFQDMRLFPHMTVAENVAFPLKMQGVPKTERLCIAEQLLEKVQMPGCGHRRISEISGGQQQRAALARALAAKPQLLLLDEPFSSLDENLREDMRTLVKELHREFHMTTVLVTHDRAEALSMSDRVAVMFEGEIAQIGTPLEVYSHPVSRRVADYFGDCVYFHGQVLDGLFVSPHITCPVQAPDGSYTMMLRCDALNPELPGNFPVTISSIQFHGARTTVSFTSETRQIWKKDYQTPPPWQVGETLRCALHATQHVLFQEDSL